MSPFIAIIGKNKYYRIGYYEPNNYPGFENGEHGYVTVKHFSDWTTNRKMLEASLVDSTIGYIAESIVISELGGYSIADKKKTLNVLVEQYQGLTPVLKRKNTLSQKILKADIMALQFCKENVILEKDVVLINENLFGLSLTKTKPNSSVGRILARASGLFKNLIKR